MQTYPHHIICQQLFYPEHKGKEKKKRKKKSGEQFLLSADSPIMSKGGPNDTL